MSRERKAVQAVLHKHFEFHMDRANGIGLDMAQKSQRAVSLLIAREIARACVAAGYEDPSSIRSVPTDLDSTEAA